MGDRLLLFGDDGSPGADVAWDWIISQRWPGWTVRAVTAGTSTRPSPRVPARHAPDTTQIEAVEPLSVIGDPGSALIGAAAALIVIGAKDPGGSERMGANTEHLIGHIGPPLVVAKRSGPVRRVLVAADGSRDARAATHALMRMPWIGEVDAVEVLGVHEERRNVERGLEECLGVLLDAGVPARRATVEGAVAHAIHAEAERFHADLVALGARGLNPLHRLGIGSTAKALARTSACGVLLAARDVDDS